MKNRPHISGANNILTTKSRFAKYKENTYTASLFLKVYSILVMGVEKRGILQCQSLPNATQQFLIRIKKKYYIFLNNQSNVFVATSHL